MGKKKILITGATGFIGTFLVHEAIKRSYKIYIAVRKTSITKHLENKEIEIVEFDFFDANSLHNLIYSLPRFEYVIHNAGITKSLDKKEYLEVNYRNTKRLVNALMQQGKMPEKFLYMSSLAAYGPGDKAIANPVLLTSTPMPLTSYGESKLAAEKFIIEKAKLPYIIIRPTAVYGPCEKDIFETIKLINKGIDFQVGTKNQRLTFVHVKDLSRLVFDALESPFFNKAYFVTDGNLYRNSDLGMIAAKRLNKKYIHIAVPVWLAKVIAATSEFVCRFSGKAPVLNIEKVNELSAANWNCDIQPIRSDFNFKPEYDLEKGMNETIDWYKKEGWLK